MSGQVVTTVDVEYGKMLAALCEPDLTLTASGGGIGAETGNTISQIVLDGAVLLSRQTVMNVLTIMRDMCFARSPLPPLDWWKVMEEARSARGP